MAAGSALPHPVPTMREIDENGNGSCPSCRSGDLISIAMTVGGRDLAFTTCHLCEAKWWVSDGKQVPFESVIGLVVQR